MSTTAMGQDAGSRLGWATRRFWPIVVATLVLFLVIGAIARSPEEVRGGRYEAAALVAAAELQIRPEQLARTASTIFRSGDVARGTAADAGLAGDADDLVPDTIDIRPVEDTVLLEVLGRDDDPREAAALANSAAGALLAELNALGAGFGSFLIVSPARPPADPLPTPGDTTALVIAGIAGLLFGAGLMGLFLSLRRPVITGAEAAELTGGPLMGQIALPRRGGAPPVEAVPGLTAIVRQVLPDRIGSVVFVSVRGGDDQRSAVALLCARVLARTGPVIFVAHGGAPTPSGERNITVADRSRVVAGFEGVPVVIDGISAEGLDVPQFLPGDARAVLIVHEGAAEQAVRDAASQFVEGELAGVVFAARGRQAPTAPTTAAGEAATTANTANTT